MIRNEKYIRFSQVAEEIGANCMVETGQRAQLGNFNRTNRKILDIERYEREKDGFVTVFPFHSFLFGIIYIKIRFLVQIEKTPQRVFKTFF